MEAISGQWGCKDKCKFQVNYKINMKEKSEGNAHAQLFYGALL